MVTMDVAWSAGFDQAAVSTRFVANVITRNPAAAANG